MAGGTALLELKIRPTTHLFSTKRISWKRGKNNKKRTLSIQDDVRVSLVGLTLLEIGLGHGTSDQMEVGSNLYKRHASLHHSGQPDPVVDIHETWKMKSPVRQSPSKTQSSHERLFMPASNVERAKEDGCMNKLKIERTNKLWHEDFKNRKNYSVISGETKTE